MTAAAAKTEYNKIDQSKVSSELKGFLTEINKETASFTKQDAESKQYYENLGQIVQIVKKNHPTAYKTARKPSTAAKKGRAVRKARVVRKTAKRKVKAKPKATVRPATKKKTTVKTAPDKSKTQQLAEVNAEIKQFQKLLKANDDMKVTLARQAKTYMSSRGLGRTIDKQLEEAQYKLKLYARLLKSDARKFKSVARIAPDDQLKGRKKTTRKVKRTTKSKRTVSAASKQKKGTVTKFLDKVFLR